MLVVFETSQVISMGNQVENHWSKFGFEDRVVVTTSPMGMRWGQSRVEAVSRLPDYRQQNQSSNYAEGAQKPVTTQCGCAPKYGF